MNKLDIEKLSQEELDKLQETISAKLSAILNKADKDANRLLGKYGLKAQMIFELSKRENNG